MHQKKKFQASQESKRYFTVALLGLEELYLFHIFTKARTLLSILIEEHSFWRKVCGKLGIRILSFLKPLLTDRTGELGG